MQIEIPLPFSIFKGYRKEGKIILPRPMTANEWDWMLKVLDVYKAGMVVDQNPPVAFGCHHECYCNLPSTECGYGCKWFYPKTPNQQDRGKWDGSHHAAR